MKESDILDILKSEREIEMVGKILRFYPRGFKIEELDIRIQKKLKELKEKFAKYNNTIEDIRRNKV